MENSSKSGILLFFLLTRLEAAMSRSQTACIPAILQYNPQHLTRDVTYELQYSHSKERGHIERVCDKPGKYIRLFCLSSDIGYWLPRVRDHISQALQDPALPLTTHNISDQIFNEIVFINLP